LKLRIHQSGKDVLDVEIDGDVLTLGRSSDCDVVLDHPYISKRHVRLLRGVVVQDLESINGTFIDGRRLGMPQVLRDGRFQMGPGDVIVEVLDADAPADDGQLRALQAENAGLAHELEELRARNEFLRLQVESSREAVTAGDGEERRARQERSLEELEELQKSYAELLDRLHAEIDELLGADE